MTVVFRAGLVRFSRLLMSVLSWSCGEASRSATGEMAGSVECKRGAIACGSSGPAFNAERLIACMRSRDREELFALYRAIESRAEVADETA